MTKFCEYARRKLGKKLELTSTEKEYMNRIAVTQTLLTTIAKWYPQETGNFLYGKKHVIQTKQQPTQGKGKAYQKAYLKEGYHL